MGDKKTTYIAKPIGVIREDSADGSLRLVWSWFDWTDFIKLFCCFVWIAAVGSGMLEVVNFGMPADQTSIFLVPASLGLAVGIGLTYYVVAHLVNHSELVVGKKTVKIRHRPLFWTGNRDVLVDRISAIEWERMEATDEEPERFKVSLVLKHGERAKLLQLSNRDLAEYVANELAKFLDLKQKLLNFGVLS